MGLFESKKIRELESINKELLQKINSISEREDDIRDLSDSLKKLRREIAEQSEIKNSIIKEIELLFVKKKTIQKEIDLLNDETLNIRQLKFDEQTSLLEYSAKLDKIKKQIDENDSLKNFKTDEFQNTGEFLSFNPEMGKNKISGLSTAISELESKRNAVAEEITHLEKTITDLRKIASLERNEYESLVSEKEKVKEILMLLEKKRDEMERTNYELEKQIEVQRKILNHDLD